MGVVGASWFWLISVQAGFCLDEPGHFGSWVIGSTGFRAVVPNCGASGFILLKASLQGLRGTTQGQVPSSAFCDASPDLRAAMENHIACNSLAPAVNKAGRFCVIA